jgi:hypothetical protein
MEVHLSEMAFTSMVLAALEAYKKETYGLLLGHRTNRGLVVQFAVPYQTADRHTSWVQRNENAHQRMENFLQNFHHISLIGDFHSHIERRGQKALCRLSSLDKKGLSSNDVCMVLALNSRQKYQAWKLNRDGILSGTVDDFFVKVGAWSGSNNGHSLKAPLFCPFALGFNWK